MWACPGLIKKYSMCDGPRPCWHVQVYKARWHGDIVVAAKVLQSEDLGEAEAFEQESMTLENLHYLHLVAHFDHAFHDGKVRQSGSQTWTLVELCMTCTHLPCQEKLDS